MKTAVIFILAFVVGLLFTVPTSLYAADVTFVWDPYEPGQELTSRGGFKIFRRSMTGTYDYTQPLHTIENPTATTTGEVKVPNEGSFFIVRAYDYTGGTNNDEYVESADSNEVFYTPAFGDKVKFIWIPSSQYMAQVSYEADRSNPRKLMGRVISESVYIHVLPDTGITSVDFYLDDPTMANAPMKTENVVPYDFAGGEVAAANPFDTKTISNGDHILTLKVTKTDSSVDLVQVPFTVTNP